MAPDRHSLNSQVIACVVPAIVEATSPSPLTVNNVQSVANHAAQAAGHAGVAMAIKYDQNDNVFPVGTWSEGVAKAALLRDLIAGPPRSG